jgi:hypothetical protein
MRRVLKLVVAVLIFENQELAYLFMICSNIELTGTAESIGMFSPAIPMRCRNRKALGRIGEMR